MARGDEETCHIEGSWRDDILLVALGIVAIRTMLRAQEDDREILVAITPADDVHHRLDLIVALGQGLVETAEELFVAILGTAADEHSRTRILLDEGDVLVVVEADNLRQMVAESLPRLLEGQRATGACLEMGMIGGRGATLRSVVEHHQFRILLEQLMNLAIGLADQLRHVLHIRNGEVDRQDGVGVDEEVVLAVDGLLELLLGTVVLAEETGALVDDLLVDAGTCRHHAGWVPLYMEGGGADHELTRLHIPQIVVAATGIVPLLELTIEEAQQGRVVHQFLLALQHLLTGLYLEGAQTVLIEVVRVDLVDREGCVAVASPSATEVELREDASDAIVTREDESQGIVLAIGGVGELYLSQQRCEEGARGSQSIDAQGIVGAVLVSPFRMVDQSWRQGVELEVAHAIGTYHHCGILLIESVDNLLQRLRR